MKLIRKLRNFTVLLAVSTLLCGLFVSTAQAQQGGPLAEILARLDTFVQDLDDLDEQTETLENPSLEDAVLDALEFKICAKFALKGGLQLKAKIPEISAKVGGGVGPNFMGSGLEVKVEPEFKANLNLAAKTEVKFDMSECIKVFELAEVIQAGIVAPYEEQDPGLTAMEDFVRSLDENAKQQILLFAEISPGDLLELMVLVLKDAGIDPTVDPDSVVNGLLGTVDAIVATEVDPSPETILGLAQSNPVVHGIPAPASMRNAFAARQSAMAAFDPASVNPCISGVFLPGLDDLYTAICGSQGLYTNVATYLDPLDRVDDVFGQAAASVKAVSEEVKSGLGDIQTDMNSVFGGVQGLFTDINTKICRTYSAGACLLGCCAKASLNPCNVTTLSISIGGGVCG